jgi:hypothetical protein
MGGTILPKPEMLLLYEQVSTMGIPLWAGGVADQGHIWLQVYRVCDDLTRIFEANTQAFQNRARDSANDPTLEGMPDWMKRMFAWRRGKDG